MALVAVRSWRRFELALTLGAAAFLAIAYEATADWRVHPPSD